MAKNHYNKKFLDEVFTFIYGNYHFLKSSEIRCSLFSKIYFSRDCISQTLVEIFVANFSYLLNVRASKFSKNSFKDCLKNPQRLKDQPKKKFTPKKQFC